jgi:2Fe-2S ferredoxin
MPKIVFIESTGARHTVDVAAGHSVMQAATENFTPGIIAECGGCLTCATCHGYVDDAWLSKVPPRSRDEEAMLEGALDPRPNSRLTCQIVVTNDLDGLIVHLPVRQS